MPMQEVGRLFIAGQKEAVVCRWDLQGTCLVLTPVKGGESQRLEVANAALTLGGFNEDQIVLKEGDLVFYAPRPALEKPLRQLGLERLHRTLGQEASRVRASVRMSYLWLGVIVFCLGLCGMFAWWVTEKAVMGATAMTPISWDVQLGKAAWQAQNFGTEELKDPAVVKPVEKIVELLTAPYAGQGFEFEVHVLDNPELNAFAMPGGQIAVFTGLLKAAEGPDELAGVLAHEIQHVVNRHGVRGVYSQLRWQMALAVLVGDHGSLHAQLMSGGAMLASLSYGRDMESEADREGLQLLKDTHLPQQGMVKFFKKLDEKQGTAERGLKYLSTHPTSAERINALEKLMTEAPGGKSVPVDWASLQKALGKGPVDASRGRK